jgi:virginiamycin A acetyltransferase
VKNVLARLANLQRRLAARRTHPLVVKSRVQDLSTVDPTAHISRSTLQGSVHVGPHAVLDDCIVTGNQPVTIGARSILSGTIRIVADRNPVSVGKFCSFAPDVSIWESLHDASRLSSHFIMGQFFGESWTRDIVSKGPIGLGSDVWIGTRSVVVSGVTVGDGAVIAAGSVVTRDIPPYAIAAGVPARVIRLRFPEATCARLLELRWWDWPEEKIHRNKALFDGELSVGALDRIA